MMSSLREISSKVRNKNWLKELAYGFKKKRTESVEKPYEDVIDSFWGDPHRAGIKPLSFVRQVLAACIYPPLITTDKLPVDVRERAQRLLDACEGGGIGSYSSSNGIPHILQSVAKYISQRDGGVPTFPEHIFITSGSQQSLMLIFKLLVNSTGSPKTGVLTPVPNYSCASYMLNLLGACNVPYYLDEELGWELQVDELRRAVQSARSICKPTAMYVINPGSPTGQVQSRKLIKDIIQFVSEEKLFLIADEVYQCTILEEGTEFVSYKRVLSEMGPPFSDTVELVSLHSVSKSLGECGLRGGYMELVNLDPTVMECLFNMFAKESPPVIGQIALDLMANPPQPGHPSYTLFTKETQDIRALLVNNLKKVIEVLNSLAGFTCQPVTGGGYVFPRINLPPRAIEKSKELGMTPDGFYCTKLLEEGGLWVSPGSVHGQKEGTHHIRISIMTSGDIMEELLRRLSIFHTQFMKKYSGKE